MKKNNDKISDFELWNFIFLAILGIGVVNLPSMLVTEVGNDAWFLVLISGAIAILLAFLMCKIGQRHANLGFVGTLRYLFGSFLGTILTLPVVIYALFVTATELRLFAEVTKLYLLRNTPLEFIILPMIIMIVVLVRMGIEPITRSFGILIFVVIFAILFIIATGYTRSDFSNILPLLKTPINKYLGGLFSVVFAFSGIELLLILFPYLRSPEKAFKVSSKAIIAVILLYAVMTVYCVAKLGVEETKASVWPVMALVKSIDMPGGFIENLEGVLGSLWVIFSFTSLVGFLFFFSVVTQGITKFKSNKQFTSMSIPILYLIALQGDSVSEVLELSNVTAKYLGLYTMILLPVLMLIVSFIRGKKQDESVE